MPQHARALMLEGCIRATPLPVLMRVHSCHLLLDLYTPQVNFFKFFETISARQASNPIQAAFGGAAS
jgi:hypothetical protein